MSLIRYYSTPLDTVFNAFTPALNGKGSSPDAIALDVLETPSAYVVKANVAGVAKDQIDVNVDDRDVTISVEFKDEPGTDAKTLYKERTQGKVTRHLRLPETVDTTSAEARHVDGVLQLTFPKVTKPSGKITIQ